MRHEMAGNAVHEKYWNSTVPSLRDGASLAVAQMGLYSPDEMGDYQYWIGCVRTAHTADQRAQIEANGLNKHYGRWRRIPRSRRGNAQGTRC